MFNKLGLYQLKTQWLYKLKTQVLYQLKTQGLSQLKTQGLYQLTLGIVLTQNFSGSMKSKLKSFC